LRGVVSYLAGLRWWSARAWYLVGRLSGYLRLNSWSAAALGRVCGPAVIGGYRYEIRGRTIDYAVLHPGHERETRAWLSDVFSKDPIPGVFLDIGAHCGSFSIPLERFFERVLALEPCPANHRALVHNLRLNDLQDKIQADQVAVSSSSGAAMLHLAFDDTHSLVSAAQPARSISVPTTTVDELLEREGIAPDRVRLLKADVEGAEIDVLRGSTGLLARGMPILLLEATSDERARALEEYVAARGYTLVRRMDQRNLLFRRACESIGGREVVADRPTRLRQCR
jgi:FkbM family methyltransferase